VETLSCPKKLVSRFHPRLVSKVLSLECRPYFFQVIFVKDADHEATFVGEDILELRPPSLSQKICFEHFVIEHRYI
jgi:hypothetical protein